MELKIDLYKEHKKSLLKIGLAILMFLSVSAGIIAQFIRKGSIDTFSWIIFGIFTMSSIANFVEGLGYRFESLFGKAYIWINDKFISLKPSAFNKGQQVNWNEIQSINYKLNRFIIQKTDNTTQIVDLSKFEYVLNMKIKEIITNIAKEKNIKNNL